MSFMRLVFPLLIREVGPEKITRIVARLKEDRGLVEENESQIKHKAKQIVDWADMFHKKYIDERFGSP